MKSDVLLSGANGVIGYPLVLRLKKDQINFKVLSRKQTDIGWQWDLQNQIPGHIVDELTEFAPNTLLHCAPIWLLPKHLPFLKQVGVQRMIVFSSSSVTSKQNSSSHSEQKLVEKLRLSEQTIKYFCAENQIALTIFRPTLVYGNRRDQNIFHIASFISRYGFFILAGKGKGLRQPVHADDLAAASLSILANSVTYGKTYYLAGAGVLSYKEMVKRVFIGLNRKPIIISLPISVFRLLLRLAAVTGRFAYTAEMANRMNRDLNYSYNDAERDFAYEPQTFMEAPERDLPLRTV